MRGPAPRQHIQRPKSARRPFWITLAVAAVLAGVFVLSLDEPPPERPAHVVLAIDGLH